MHEFGGNFPKQRLELERLKGVGRSTAAAISAFAFQQRETILDGNVKRVLCRVFALDGATNDKKFERELWDLAEKLLPEHAADMPTYTQGLMDLGATVCARKPRCEACPMRDICQAYARNLTDQLPRKKAAPTVQNLTLYWLILRDKNGAIFLIKRPSKGIWANLFCVPTCENPDELAKILHEKYEKLPKISHRLTHRQLTIVPFWVENFSGNLNNFSGKWVSQSELSQIGLPKPLHELIHKFCV